MSHEEQDGYCQRHAEKLDELKTAVEKIADYIPKIETAIERSLDVKEAMKHSAEINRETFGILRNLTEDLARVKSEELTAIKLKHSDLEGRVKALEESRKGIMGVVSPVITWALVGILTGLTILFVSHGVGGQK